MSNEPQTETPKRPRPWLPLGALVAGAVLVAGLCVVYGMQGVSKETTGGCATTAAAMQRIDPLIYGEVAALNLARPPRLAPDLTFNGPDGAPKTMADFKGKTVLLNLWATWCGPCRKEMPALDKLQNAIGGADFQVVAINVDTAKLERPKQFLTEVGATHLPFYADPTGAVLQTAKEDGPVMGLPTTFLLDKNGCTIATMAGPADWASDDARRVIEAAKS